MTTYQWGQWAATAKAASGGPTLPEGEGYTGEVVDAGAKPAKNGQPRLWWKFKVLVGPSAGETEIMSQSLNPDNPKALAAFYGVCGRLGIDFAVIPDGTPPEAVAKTVIGRRFTFDFSHRADDKDPSRKYGDFKSLVRIDAAPVATTPAAPAAIVVPPAAVPAVEAAAAAPAVVPAPAAAPSVDDLQAQIAALQAQQAAAAAPAPAAESVVPGAGTTVTPPAPGGTLPF